MSNPHPSSTADLVKSLRILARDIQSGDGVANAVCAEAAERLESLSLCEDPLIRSMSVEGGRMEVTLEAAKGTVLHIAESISKVLGDAANYVEIDVSRASGESFVLRLQRRNGKSPHELRAEAERKAEQQRLAIATALDHLLRIWPDGAKCNHDWAREAFRAMEAAL